MIQYLFGNGFDSNPAIPFWLDNVSVTPLTPTETFNSCIMITTYKRDYCKFFFLLKFLTFHIKINAWQH